MIAVIALYRIMECSFIHRISCELAELSTQLRNHDNGVRFYREALLHNESHSPARLALAQLHLSKGEMEASDHECVTLLRTDPENEQAAVVRNGVDSQ
jgi:lipopolysaccharide biosynthesis regulator YciM